MNVSVTSADPGGSFLPHVHILLVGLILMVTGVARAQSAGESTDSHKCGTSGWHWDRCEVEEGLSSGEEITEKDGRRDGAKVFWVGFGVRALIAVMATFAAFASVDSSPCNQGDGGSCDEDEEYARYLEEVRERLLLFHGIGAVVSGAGGSAAAWAVASTSERWERPALGKMMAGALIGSSLAWLSSLVYLEQSTVSPGAAVLTLGIIPTVLPTLIESTIYMTARKDRLKKRSVARKKFTTRFVPVPVIRPIGEGGSWVFGVTTGVVTF